MSLFISSQRNIATKGSWLGVMGGGQLGRLFTQAAQRLGYRVAVLSPEPSCPAAQWADRHIHAHYDDHAALDHLATLCIAITTEFEQVPAQSLRRLAQNTFVSPNAEAVAIAQNRCREKAFFRQVGVSIAPYHPIDAATDIDRIPTDYFPGILKTAQLGYDGRGQQSVHHHGQVHQAVGGNWNTAYVLEKKLSLRTEISVLIARSHTGNIVVYPAAENYHRQGILLTTTIPAQNIPPKIAASAQTAAIEIAEQLHYVGVLCVEFFILENGELVVNEMAPRPHNSGHYTLDVCHTSQFEQQVRSMAKLPLGRAIPHHPAVMLNLLGDLWLKENQGKALDLRSIQAFPGTHLYLYGKTTPRPLRKMGHMTFTAPSLPQAQAQCASACALLGINLFNRE